MAEQSAWALDAGDLFIMLGFCLFLICKLDGFPNQFFKKSALLALVPMFLPEEEYCQCVCHLKFYIL